MPNSRNQPTCPSCNRLMTLELQAGAKSPRTFQCLDCGRPDPMGSPHVEAIMHALQPMKPQEQ
jgi:tRNA(Ile2) C34 agmatinyltransferase TiaS